MSLLISLKYILMSIIGLASGFTVAAALFTFIVTLGVISRLAEVSHTSKYIHWYETCVTVGGTLGNLMMIYLFPIHTGYIGLGIFGLLTGIFVGCFIGAIAEVLNAFPIFFRRLHLKRGILAIIIALAVGKGIGVFVQYFIM